MTVQTGLFGEYAPHSNNWTHVVLNYLGPDDGQGSKIYLNGILVASDSMKDAFSYPQGDGSVVLGRRFTHIDGYYPNADVDEILFFNQSLTDEQISQLGNI